MMDASLEEPANRHFAGHHTGRSNICRLVYWAEIGNDISIFLKIKFRPVLF